MLFLNSFEAAVNKVLYKFNEFDKVQQQLPKYCSAFFMTKILTSYIEFFTVRFLNYFEFFLTINI